MMEEELERMKEASQADPSIVVQPPARPPRHQKWKAARMKGDKYVNADVAEDALEQQSSQGSFTPATRMDILSTAIGKPDYLDACRGETRGVSVAKYFGRRSRSYDDDNPSPQLVEKIRAKLVDEIMAQVRGEMRNTTNPEDLLPFDPEIERTILTARRVVRLSHKINTELNTQLESDSGQSDSGHSDCVYSVDLSDSISDSLVVFTDSSSNFANSDIMTGKQANHHTLKEFGAPDVSAPLSI
ncbi:hypothetical protein K1719_023976 [Acacia pycnantha]|nr:hypothetical protein K1719_023976 [Acacia pycnantha]